MVQLLLFVILLNVVIFILLWRFDVFVNSELYNFGLVFSYDWASDYWHYNGMVWGFQIGSGILVGLSIIPQHQLSVKPNKTSKYLGFLLPTLAIFYQSISLYFLWQIDSLVQKNLVDFGLIFDAAWTVTYNPYIASTFALMVTSLIALIIPTIRTWGIIEIEIVKEK